MLLRMARAPTCLSMTQPGVCRTCAAAKAAAQVRDIRIERIEPSLEDVFVDIVERFLMKNETSPDAFR